MRWWLKVWYPITWIVYMLVFSLPAWILGLAVVPCSLARAYNRGGPVIIAAVALFAVLHLFEAWWSVAAAWIYVAVGLIAFLSPLNEHNWPWLFWLWGNDEDDPRIDDALLWWRLRCATDKVSWKGWKNTAGYLLGWIPVLLRRWFPSFWWYQIRNPQRNSGFILKDRECSYSGNWTERDMHANEVQDHGLTVAHRWGWTGWLGMYERVRINDDNTSNEIWIGWKLYHTTPGLGFATQWKRRQKISTIHGGADA